MTVSQTPRLGITKWSAGTDPLARSQLNLDADQLELLTAIDVQGTYASRPAAGTRGRYFWATDKLRLYRDDGAAWVDLMDPAGTLFLTATATTPPGYLLCDGAAVLRTTYADLFTALGGTNTPWGLPGGVGGTTFNVPDLRGRVPLGVGTGAGLTARVLGTLYGAETVALSLAESPVHYHTVNNHSHGGGTGNDGPDHGHWMQHNHGVDTQGAHKHAVAGSYGFVICFRTDNGGNGLQPGGERATFTDMSTEGGHGHNVDNGWRNSSDGANARHTHGVNLEAPGTDNKGSGTAHANVQPSAGVNYMIRT